MAVNTQFSIAVHIMAGLGYSCRQGYGLTTTELAESVNTSPSFIRRIFSKLSKAGLINTATGKAGGCWLSRTPENISLLDIYRAVDAPHAFAIHTYAEKSPCEVSCHIKSALQNVLNRTQEAMEKGLLSMTLADVIHDLKHG